MKRMTTWRTLLLAKLESNGEGWSDVAAHTFTGTELDDEFNKGYGLIEGCPFTLWTKERVYFPLQYDGKEYVGVVSRNVSVAVTPHQ